MAYLTPVSTTSSYGVVQVGSGINVTNGVISVLPNGQINTVLVEDPDSPYSVTGTDEYIGVVGSIATIDIDLPFGTDGRELIIKAEFGNLSNIQITPQVGEYVEGAGGGYLLNTITGTPSVTLIYRDTNWNIV